MNAAITAKHEQLKLQLAKLDSLSPLSVLTRGYSITQTDDGILVRTAEQVKPGDKLKITLERGKLNAKVLDSEP
jgi:exodeoxyribonuclease VII large subunit